MKFNNFYTPSAVCTPSRGCFVTGRYPHAHGVYRNGEGLAKDQITFAHVLKEVGYETGYIGKWHIASKDTYNWMTTENSMGFDKCKNMINCMHQKTVQEMQRGDPGDRACRKFCVNGLKTLS